MLIALLCTGDLNEPSNFNYPILQGLIELANGDSTLVHQLNPSVVRPDEMMEYDLVVSNGIGRGRIDECREVLRGKIPWLVYDLGYVDRYTEEKTNGYLQLSIDGLNWLPDFSVNNNRRLIGYIKRPKLVKNTVLITAQNPGDPAHGMNHQEIVKWTDDVIKTVLARSPTITIWYRNHPRNPNPYYPAKAVIKDDRTSEYWVDLAGSVITYNSVSAIYAIASNKIVYSSENAVYSKITNRIEEFGDPKDIDSAEFNDFFARLGYCQWTHKELATGQPFKDLLEIYEDQIPVHWIENPDAPENLISQQEYELAKQAKHEKQFFKARSLAKQEWPDEVFHNQLELSEFLDKKIYEFNQQIIKRT